MINNIINTKDTTEYIKIISDLMSNPQVLKMENFKQHYNTSCLDHCLEVSYISYIICKKLGLDYVAAARAGLLHDLFLYDWRKSHIEVDPNLQGLHAFAHPKIALKNSLELFDLNSKEQDIIVKHMWPITFFEFPKYKETYIITLVDKYSALRSSKNYYSGYLKKKTFIKYAYVFLALLVFNI